MATINKADNVANITYGGETIKSNSVQTVFLLAPTIVKAVDKLTASVGDVLTYTITVTNLALNPITNLAFTDAVPPGTTYVTDSFKVNNVAATPTFTNNTLGYTVPTIAALGTAVIQFQATVTGVSDLF